MPEQGRKFVVIGGAGVVGSAVSSALITQHGGNVVICDRFRSTNSRKWANIPIAIDDIWSADNLIENLNKSWRDIAGVVLLADAGHASQDCDAIFEAAFHLPRRIWDYCAAKQRPLYWASSSHVYGAGQSHLSTAPQDVAALNPVTAFGRAKLAFDIFAARQGTGPDAPPIWAGYRLSSVYGRTEAHKGDLASLPVRSMQAAHNETELRVAHKISRDWVHVDDAACALASLVVGQHAGFFDIGTGTTTTTADLIASVENVVGKGLKTTVGDVSNEAIISLPAANMTALADAGVSVQFQTLAQGLASL